MNEIPKDVSSAFVQAAVQQLEEGLHKICHCVRQLNQEQVWWRPREEQNSIANLLLHLAGNVRQWIIVGVTDAPDHRDRPREFAERGPIPPQELLARLETTVQEAIGVLREPAHGALLEPRRIQAFDTYVLAAIFHSVSHFQGHVQEIISLTRQQLGPDYEFDFVPQSHEQGA